MLYITSSRTPTGPLVWGAALHFKASRPIIPAGCLALSVLFPALVLAATLGTYYYTERLGLL